MGNCITTFPKKEIISEKSLIAVHNVVEYLKEDVIQRDIFRNTGHEGMSEQIAKELGKGGPSLYRLLEDASMREIASGLMGFLVHLRKPLLPHRIQAIVLDIIVTDPDNKTVTPEVVAQDVLGLINQELDGRHFKLVQYILDLLNHVLKYTPTDELSGSNIPIFMMPIFFNFQAEHILHWRRVGAIFVELIRLAPQHLNIVNDNNDFPDNNLVVQNRNIMRELLNPPNENIVHERVEIVLRRYLIRADNRGDSSCLEVYSRPSRTYSQRRRFVL